MKSRPNNFAMLTVKNINPIASGLIARTLDYLIAMRQFLGIRRKIYVPQKQ